MENENAIVKRDQQSFIERLVEKAGSLNDIKQVGDVIISSGFCPDHFKQSKDSVGVIMCIEAGKQLGMSWMQALSDLYPVKGRIGMMGDAAVALVQGSGLCEYWKENTEGTFPNRDYKHIIISKRKGYPNENKTEFSVFDAESAGLMTKDIYKRYGKRMIRYRCVGFHTRDFYSDVLKGMKTVEELQDYDANLLSQTPGETKLITKDGKEIKVPNDKAEQSERIAQSVSSHIEKANGKLPNTETAQDVIHEVEQITLAEEVKQEWTEASLTEMGTRIYEFAEKNLPAHKYKLLESIPGKKSNKRFREALLAFQEGTIDKWLTDALKANQVDTDASQVETLPQQEKVVPEKSGEAVEGDLPWENKTGGVTTAEATKSFEAQRVIPQEQTDDESSDIPVISELNPANGKRSFGDAIKLTNFFKSNIGITDANINDQIKGTGLEFPSLGNFCERAEKSIVEMVIQKNL